MIRLFHLQNPPPIQSDNYETNAADPCCLSGNGHERPATQREGSDLHVSTGPDGRGVFRGLRNSPLSQERDQLAQRSELRVRLVVTLSEARELKNNPPVWFSVTNT